LTLKPAFAGGDRQELLRQIAFEEPRPPRRLNRAIPAELETIVLKAMEKNPVERYATAQDLADDLERFLNDESIRAKRPTLWQRTRKWTRRHRAAAWAAGVLLVVVAILAGGNSLWWAQRRAAADGAVGQAMNEARLLYLRAKEKPLGDGSPFREALVAARKAEELAQASAASGELQQQAAELAGEVQEETEAANRDRRLLVRLLDVRGPREAARYHPDSRGLMIELAEPSADEQFAAAFRAWGLDVDATPVAEAAARCKSRPPAVLTEVVAALDEWASERRYQGLPPAAWQRLADLAAALDDQPDSRRRELRVILTRGKLPLERALGEVSHAFLPTAALADVVPGPDRNRLRRLAVETDAATEPVLGLLTLARALQVAGDHARAAQLLREAVWARPAEVVLHNALGKLLEEQRPPAWGRAVECYMAVRTLRPELGFALVHALVGNGCKDEAQALFARLVVERPDNPWLLQKRANLLGQQSRYKEAEAAYREAIRLKPDEPMAYNNLAWLLATGSDARFQDPEEAIRLARKALALAPKDHHVWNTLGVAQYRAKDWKAAIATLDTAMKLRKGNNVFGDCCDWFFLAMAHWHLGEKEKAREWYDRGVHCIDKNQPHHEELPRFRAEAAALLGAKEENK
jgi:tetratricopeptide (TPR) repeat protein